jgi:hypothetical protein
MVRQNRHDLNAAARPFGLTCSPACAARWQAQQGRAEG